MNKLKPLGVAGNKTSPTAISKVQDVSPRDNINYENYDEEVTQKIESVINMFP